MTNEEAIKSLRLEGGLEISGNARRLAEFMEALDFALSALKKIQENNSIHIDREAWEPCGYCNGAKYIYGHASAVVPNGYKRQIEKETEGDFDYCPKCGRPLTDEAWNELEERLRRCNIQRNILTRKNLSEHLWKIENTNKSVSKMR